MAKTTDPTADTPRRVGELLAAVEARDLPPRDRMKSLLEGIRGAFRAAGPATLFFANTLVPPTGQRFVLHSHHYVGDVTGALAERWERHLVRGANTRPTESFRSKGANCIDPNPQLHLTASIGSATFPNVITFR